MNTDWLKLINWKTSACAVGIVLCRSVSHFVPEVALYCSMLDTLFTAGGFVSAADAMRVQNVVGAVDHLLVEVKSSLLHSAPSSPIVPPTVS